MFDFHPFYPKLYLAPMEGVADRCFRISCARFYPHFDEATTEFIRLPRGGHIPSLIAGYDPLEIDPIPLAAQVMTHCPFGAAAIVTSLQEKGAQRIELNCGCPSNTVTGRGAGSALLEDPDHLGAILQSMRRSCHQTLSVKMRIGFKDSSLFEKNLEVIESSGVDLLTIHPRTKEQGYRLPCDWGFLAFAKKRLSIPIVGSGEIKSACEAIAMADLLQDTSTRPYDKMGLMVGRAALGKPWIFAKIKIAFLERALLSVLSEDRPFLEKSIAYYESFLEVDRALCWLDHLYESWHSSIGHSKGRVRRIKQQINALFDPRLYESCSEEMVEALVSKKRELLRFQGEEGELFTAVKRNWKRLLIETGELF